MEWNANVFSGTVMDYGGFWIEAETRSNADVGVFVKGPRGCSGSPGYDVGGVDYVSRPALILRQGCKSATRSYTTQAGLQIIRAQEHSTSDDSRRSRTSLTQLTIQAFLQ